MLIYDAKSPAPRCLRMFLLEKRLVLPAVTVDVFTGENHQSAFLAINPAGQTPALLCDDGSTLGEAVAIAEYLEELHPAPALIGSTPEQRAQTRQWWRRVELNITEFIHNAYHYAESLTRFESRIPVLPQAATGLKAIAQDRLRWLDFALTVNQPFDRSLPHVGLWFARMAARPSAAGNLPLLWPLSNGEAHA